MSDNSEKKTAGYDESNIKSVKPLEHIRLRPGMYVGAVGNGDSPEDGIYVLLKEVIDNSIDEFVMKAGDRIVVDVDEKTAHIRDYGRGIPQGKLVECVSNINTGGKFDEKAFQFSIGLNGVGLKAVNALSSSFEIRSYRDGKCAVALFEKGEKVSSRTKTLKNDENGTEVFFTPDDCRGLFEDYHFDLHIVEDMINNYIWLNRGLTIVFNGKSYKSRYGLKDLLEKKLEGSERLYDIAHYTSKDGSIEFSFTHVMNSYSEEYYSYANGQYTFNGGTHQSFYKEALYKGISVFFKKDWTPSDVREGIVAAIAVKVHDPRYDSQTKSKLTNMEIKSGIMDFVMESLNDFFLKNKEAADTLCQKITSSQQMHKEITDLKKKSKEVQLRTKFNVPDLRDCKYHLTDKRKSDRAKAENSMLFICEGKSAANPFTRTRDAETQAVFPVRGKVKNVEKSGGGNDFDFDDSDADWARNMDKGGNRNVIYKNAELFDLVTALGIENDSADLRYAKIVIATDADVDGYHIRMLLITFFINYYPELVTAGKLYVLETPLFKIRGKSGKSSTIYCYSEKERDKAIEKMRNFEITRFKGLGEIDPPDFKKFVGPEMKLLQVNMSSIAEMRKEIVFYMGNNTEERYNFIVENLI